MRVFLTNLSKSLLRRYKSPTSCKIPEKTNESVLKFHERMHERTHGGNFIEKKDMTRPEKPEVQ